LIDVEDHRSSGHVNRTEIMVKRKKEIDTFFGMNQRLFIEEFLCLPKSEEKKRTNKERASQFIEALEEGEGCVDFPI
jgi:hypothetical protein